MRMERTAPTQPAGSNLSRRLQAAVTLLDRTGSGFACQSGTYIRGDFSSPVSTILLDQLGLTLHAHELPGGKLQVSVSLAREIRLDTKEMRPASSEGRYEGSNFPIYLNYEEDRSTFSFATAANFETVFGRLVAAAALCETKDCLSLGQWIRRNPPDGNRSAWASNARAQFNMLDDLRAAGLAADPKGSIFNVVGSHNSKSVILPVVSLSLANPGFRLWLSNNFDAWWATVEADVPLKHLDTNGLTMDKKWYDPVYFYGFDRAGVPIYGPYRENHSQFSFLYSPNKDIALIFQRLIEAARAGSKG
ncbi:MAG: hypothetical protein JW873_06985 [Candidatus Saganbacteria bacterium]|nr:hypothetical protein [Candidatus Saganbacteria bacterium]